MQICEKVEKTQAKFEFTTLENERVKTVGKTEKRLNQLPSASKFRMGPFGYEP